MSQPFVEEQRKMYQYNVFGVNIRSDIHFPELRRGRGACDVQINLDKSGTSLRKDVDRYTWLKLGRDEAVLFIDEIGQFELRQGQEIRIKPAADVRESLLRLYLLGSVMGILFYQRGRLALHASSVVVNGQAIAFLAESGWGKSSLATVLGQRGHSVLSDDLTPVELAPDSVCIYPGPSYLKISSDVAAAVGIDWDALIAIDPLERKRRLPVTSTLPEHPFLLSTIYVLIEDSLPEILPLPPQEAVLELIRHTYPIRLGYTGDALHLQQCGQLASKTRIVRLVRSPSLSSLSDLAAFVEADLAGK